MEGTLTLANEALARLVGVPAPDLVGRPVRTLFDPGEHERLETTGLRTGAWRLAGPEGAPVQVWLVRFPVEDGVAIAAVTPEEPTMVAAVHRMQSSFQALAENVPGALFRYIMSPDGRNRVIYMSPGCREVWEVEPEAIQDDATLLWSMVHEEDLPGMRASVQASARDLTRWFWEWRITTPSGREKWLQGVGRPQREADGSTLWNTLILDVTERRQQEMERRRLEAQLRQAQKLEALGRVATGVAHDYNNMLTVILGGLDALLDKRDRDPDEVAQLESILDAANRSAALTRQLLGVSRQRSERAEPVDLRDHIRRCAHLLRRLAGPNVDLRLTLPDDVAPVLIDRTHLDQILTNLIRNASQATAGDGTIDVSIGQLRTARGDEVVLTVQDTGIGMPPEIRARIFEPFYTTRESGEGTGLGLATVFTLVRRAAGTIEVDSTVGVGTTFRIHLPAGGGAIAGPATPGTPPGCPLTALLVEDEGAVRRVIATHLREQGCTVIPVPDAERALQAAAEQPFDVLIADIGLPGMNGRLLADRLRLARPDLPVLLLVGPNEDVWAGTNPPQGERLLHKPFPLDALDRELTRALDGVRQAG